MELNIYTKGWNHYDASGVICDDGVVVKKGSIVSKKATDNLNPIVKRLREDKSIISEKGEVIIDVKFKSLSTAATFVTGYVSNGFRTWKTKDGEDLRKILGGKKDGRDKV